MRKIVVLALLFLLLPIAEMALTDVVTIKTPNITYASPEASNTIRILSNGTITPYTPNIWTSDYSTYVLSGDLIVPADIGEPAIIIERDNIVIDGGGYKLEGINSYSSIGILLQERTNVIIKNMEITKFYMGIRIIDSSEISLIRNKITINTRAGIRLECLGYNVTDNSIIENEITKNKDDAIRIEPRFSSSEFSISGTRIIGNRITGNDGAGIAAFGCLNNNVSGNHILGNLEGIYCENVNNTIIKGNNIGGQSYRGVILNPGDNNEIIRNNITGNGGAGIYLMTASYNSISKNNIRENGAAGIWISGDVHFNIITRNTIEDNERGIWIYKDGGWGDDPSNNFIFLNNFYDNVEQVVMGVTTPSATVFDEGYPSGGNYWSHYKGVDVKSGPSQDSPGSDGVIDSPFIIYDDPEDDKDIKDSYPFMAPVGSVDVGTLGEKDYGVDFVTNSTAVSAFLFNPYADHPYISFEVEGEEGTAGFCRVKIPKAVLSAGNTEWIVEVNGQPVEYTVSSDAENTYLYFTYHHSVQEVKIIGTGTQFTPPPPPPPPDTPPSPVTLNPPSEIAETSMKLSWTESVDTDFKKYTVYQSNTGGSLGTPIYTATMKSATSYTVAGLAADTTYYFTVRVYDTGDLYADSNQVSGKTLAAPPPVTVESCDPAGNTKNTFNLGEGVYVKGGGYSPSTKYVVYIVADADWVDGMTIPDNVAWKYVSTDPTGNLPPEAVWPKPLTAGKYDIVVDVNENGVYDKAVDALDDFDVKTAGFFVIPEYWLGTVLGLTGCFAALGAYYMSKRRRIYHPGYQ